MSMRVFVAYSASSLDQWTSLMRSVPSVHYYRANRNVLTGD